MKRSEALDIVLNAYTAWLYGECGDKATRRDLAELVLSRLEEVGMLPPEYHNYNPDQVSRTFSSDSDWGRGEDGPNGEYRSYLKQNEWEPE